MICADTSCWIPYLAGETGRDMEVLDEALAREAVGIAPVVLAELLSAPNRPKEIETELIRLKFLSPHARYWERSGKLRAVMRTMGLKPKLADTLIAQTCIDHCVSLLTRDRDFKPFAKHAGLVLL